MRLPLLLVVVMGVVAACAVLSTALPLSPLTGNARYTRMLARAQASPRVAKLAATGRLGVMALLRSASERSVRPHVRDEACPATTCAACVATAGCVWATSYPGNPNEEESTLELSKVAVQGGCWSGSPVMGPTPRTDTIFVHGFTPAFMNDDDAETNATKLFWSSARACSVPVSISSNEPDTESASTAGVAYGNITIERQLVNYPSTYGYAFTDVMINNLRNELNAFGEDDGFSAFIFIVLRLVAVQYQGLVGVSSSFTLESGSDDVLRGAIGASSVGYDLSAFYNFVADVILQFAKSGPSEMNTPAFDATVSAGVRRIFKTATAFVVVLDRVTTVAGGAQYTATGATLTSTMVSGLKLVEYSAFQQATATVLHYALNGSLSDGSAFMLDCFQGSDQWTHLERSIPAAALECDVNMYALRPAAGASIGLSAVVVAIDVGAILTGSAGAPSTSTAIGAGGAFNILDTASVTSSAGVTTVAVTTANDDTCGHVDFITPELLAKVRAEAQGAIALDCKYYTFATGPLSSVTRVFWDPSVSVDEVAALKAIEAAIAADNKKKDTPFYRKTWFYAACVAVALTIVVSVVVAVLIAKKKKKAVTAV